MYYIFAYLLLVKITFTYNKAIFPQNLNCWYDNIITTGSYIHKYTDMLAIKVFRQLHSQTSIEE